MTSLDIPKIIVSAVLATAPMAEVARDLQDLAALFAGDARQTQHVEARWFPPPDHGPRGGEPTSAAARA